MNKVLIVVFAIFIAASSFGQKKAPKVKLKTEIDSLSYCLGTTLGKSMKQGGLETINFDIFVEAIESVYKNDSLMFNQTQSNAVLQAYFEKAQKNKNSKNLKEGQDFLAKNKTAKGVITTASGLQYEVLREGNGEKPGESDTVKVHYHGTLLNGTVFDSSIERGEPIEFRVDEVIPGWKEALQLMSVGSKFKLWIPAELAYGENPAPGGPIEPNAMLIFEVELLSVKKSK